MRGLLLEGAPAPLDRAGAAADAEVTRAAGVRADAARVLDVAPGPLARRLQAPRIR